jgi:CAAX prenyl protease-like protein
MASSGVDTERTRGGGSGTGKNGGVIRQGHGWWPYWAPYLSFLVLADLGRKLPDAVQPALLVIKPLVPVILLIWFLRRGEYPELRGQRWDVRWTLADVALGVALALLWMAPYIVFAGLRPDPADDFDPAQFGEALVPLALGLRLAGYAVVTPLFEELFIRSWVMRFADVYGREADFRDVPLAHYTLRSFLSTIVVFTVAHVPWEWWVAVPWVAITNLWFYKRKSLPAVMVVHGVTNATLLLFAVYGGELFHDPDGSPISLWFFV